MIEKVLVADDEPLMLRFIAETLRRQGKEVSLPENGIGCDPKARRGALSISSSAISKCL